MGRGVCVSSHNLKVTSTESEMKQFQDSTRPRERVVTFLSFTVKSGH